MADWLVHYQPIHLSLSIESIEIGLSFSTLSTFLASSMLEKMKKKMQEEKK